MSGVSRLRILAPASGPRFYHARSPPKLEITAQAQHRTTLPSPHIPATVDPDRTHLNSGSVQQQAPGEMKLGFPFRYTHQGSHPRIADLAACYVLYHHRLVAVMARSACESAKSKANGWRTVAIDNDRDVWESL